MKIKGLKNQTYTITGLTRGDLRLIARAVEKGSFAGGDQGGDVSQALLRLGKALRVPCMFDGKLGDVELVSGVADASRLFEEAVA